MDTGSSLVWLQCDGCTKCFKQIPIPFPKGNSSSFRTITYKSKPAFYKCEYTDGDSTRGILAYETFYLETKTSELAKIENIKFGCGVENNILYVKLKDNKIVGIMGLGWEENSFVKQLGPKSKGKFSYCLPRINSGNAPNAYLRFGDDALAQNKLTKSTQLIRMKNKDLYYVEMLGISMNRAKLNISPQVFAVKNSNSRTACSKNWIPQYKEYYLHLDTGSSLTWLQCNGCKKCFNQTQIPFPNEKSSSFRALIEKGNQLGYVSVYGDGDITSGILAHETFYFKTKKGLVKIENVQFGCGLNNVMEYGEYQNNKIAGIMGIGWGDSSLINQLGPEVKGKFSYCLPVIILEKAPKTYLRIKRSALQFKTQTLLTETRIETQQCHYILKIGIGTFKSDPPYKEYYLEMDTGSSLVWLQCHGCTKCFNQIPQPFPAKNSSSFRPLLIEKGPKQYEYEYQDRAITRGVLAHETFHLRSKADKSSNAYLVLGDTGKPQPKSSSKTPLLRTDQNSPYYVALQDISVNKNKLRIKPEVFLFDGNNFTGGCIIDTGTPYSRIITPAFKILVKALENYFSSKRGLKRLGRNLGLELCYERKGPGGIDGLLPEITFHLKGTKADFVVGPEAGFDIVGRRRTGARQYFCLAMVRDDGMTLIGTHQQANKRVIHDFGKKELVFYDEDCSK
ncbi:Unknown protein [Striga hermonthica]|uniref:Peptidase A1 domain-containing protein n=1 Tax=Striga hermonthica TaxID=68872 RepID=A0A9N7N7A2_STRHE|nr:Unknown protein [Striga hermonthica]